MASRECHRVFQDGSLDVQRRMLTGPRIPEESEEKIIRKYMAFLEALKSRNTE